jgi:hypothetical protein
VVTVIFVPIRREDMSVAALGDIVGRTVTYHQISVMDTTVPMEHPVTV